MSKVLGIIAEYNPFHNGHLYHLEEAKKKVDPDYTVCVISGNFVQRGDSSLIDKWSKAEMALACGVDLVIEIPTVYAISSAENFARGSIKLLESLSDDVTLCFGSETGEIDVLQQFAEVLCENPPEYVSLLSHELERGISYPKARENALLMYLNDIRKFANVLSGSNNILGIEYLRAIKEMNSKVVGTTIKRISVADNSLETANGYASATGIRHMLKNEESVKEFLPEVSYNILHEQLKYGKIVTDLSVFEKELLYALRRMSVEEIAEIADVTEGLENRIKEACNSCNTLEELMSLIKTKRYTQTRIQRVLLYSLLNITKKDIEESYKVKPYLRVLGFNTAGKRLLSEMNLSKKNVITSVKRFMDTNKNKQLKNMLEKDILASNIYTLGYGYDSKANLDYTQKMIVV
ncbi:MAG: nucleotidyltransferase [Oscillospiraceae bacterium]|nr:nucleotidyltransferase [Oscillospiraceae bacterium]